MATLPITIPDANVPRVQAAFGHQAPPPGLEWIPATSAEVQAAITNWLRQYVRNYEEALASAEAIEDVTDAV